jgi:hypothetical protein
MVPLLYAYLTTALILSPLLLVKFATSLPPKHLLRDAHQVMGAPFYIGLYSNLGILLWCAATTLCLFTSFLLRPKIKEKETSSFLFFFGIFTGLLLVDDFFMVHEKVLPRIFGMAEESVMIFYLIVLLICIQKFWKTILKSDWRPFILAFGFFGISIFLDSERFEEWMVWEDVMKLFGIVSWFVYFLEVCGKKLRQAVNSTS